jgi:hypothetical protein
MKVKKKYSVLVGNIGNIGCDTRRVAVATFQTYRKLSMDGYGRAAFEPVQLLKDDEVIKEFDPDVVLATKGTFRHLAWSYLQTQSDDALYRVINFKLVRDAGGGWEVNDSHGVADNLSRRACLDLMCEQWELFKIRYCRKAQVKDVEEVSEQADSLEFEVRQLPFLVLRVSLPKT